MKADDPDRAWTFDTEDEDSPLRIWCVDDHGVAFYHATNDSAYLSMEDGLLLSEWR